MSEVADLAVTCNTTVITNNDFITNCHVIFILKQEHKEILFWIYLKKLLNIIQCTYKPSYITGSKLIVVTAAMTITTWWR
jgi:hypothetical protein